MDGITPEIIKIIYELLPGFIVAWILYGLTAYLKPTSFERIIQALIFTVIVRAILITIRCLFLYIGESCHSFGVWNKDVEFVWSIIIAITSGLFLTWCVNNDLPLSLFRKDGIEGCHNGIKWINKLLSKINLTSKTLHPSEWYSAFSYEPRFVVLHLKGERRLYGWPKQYPDDPQKGHFLIEEAAWLLDDGSSASLYSVKQLLIPTSEIEYVEFVKNQSEVKVDNSKIEETEKLLTNLYKKKEDSNADECAPKTT